MTYLCHIGILFIFVGSISAQDIWSLQDTWDVLLENNYQIKTQKNLLLQADTDISRNRALLLPHLSAISSYRYQSELAELELPFPGADKIQAGTNLQYDIAVTLSQPVFTGFRNLNALRGSYIQRDIRTAGQTALQQQLMLRAGLLYYEIQKNMLQEKTLLASLRRAENQLVRIRSLRNAKQAIAFDTLETANRKLEIQNNIYALRDYNKILRSQLSNIVHTDTIPELASLNVHFRDSLKLTLAQWQEKALHHRQELIQVDKTIELQAFQTDMQRANYYPNIYANASYHYARPGVNFFVDEWMNYYTVGIQMEWNLWNWRRDALGVQKAALEEDRIQLSRRELEINIKNEVKQAYLQIQTAATQVKLHEQLVRQEEERYRITNERFEQGLTTILDVNSAEESLKSAQLQLMQNIINWYIAKMRLAYAAGNIFSVN
jgi:outer membrane protein